MLARLNPRAVRLSALLAMALPLWGASPNAAPPHPAPAPQKAVENGPPYMKDFTLQAPHECGYDAGGVARFAQFKKKCWRVTRYSSNGTLVVDDEFCEEKKYDLKCL